LRITSPCRLRSPLPPRRQLFRAGPAVYRSRHLRGGVGSGVLYGVDPKGCPVIDL
jgi:hypothetical protein